MLLTSYPPRPFGLAPLHPAQIQQRTASYVYAQSTSLRISMQPLTDSTSSQRNGIWLALIQSLHDDFMQSGFRQFSTLSFGFDIITAKLQNGHSTCDRHRSWVWHLTCTLDLLCLTNLGTSCVCAPSLSVPRHEAQPAVYVPVLQRTPSLVKLS